jgi:hypothetical protein
MTELIHDLLTLRLAVGYLGQRTNHHWWDCDFLNPSGLESLAYNFPRAPKVAGFTATCLAVKRLHDERIGRTDVTHLFRLPPELEILLHRETGKDNGHFLRSCPLDKDWLMSEIQRLAEHEIDSPEGPVQVGLTEHAATRKSVAQLAAHYLAGFRQRRPILPYFASRPS